VSVPVQASDKQLVEFLSRSGRQFLIVGTKSDRLSGNQLKNSLWKLEQEFSTGTILPFSARNGDGRDELWKKIRTASQELRGLASQG
jgi:GTP-binding protein